jgi:selenide,water dikinase
MGPEALAQVLRPLQGMFAPADYPDLLQGLAVPDDAAVWRLDGNRALVLTSDFFPPVVDDPYSFGAIAAANALSDLYAMGAKPLLAINLVGFPDNLDRSILSEILRGGAEKVREAGAVIAGGHTTVDTEPKYGLAVIGMVHPEKVLTKGGARPGDLIYLTKPLGTGVVTTAQKRDAVDEKDLQVAIESMCRLHTGAANLLGPLEGAVHAATDITGFGLAGHAHEVAELSGLTLQLSWDKLPLLPGAARYAREDFVPGGAKRNLEYYGKWIRWACEPEDWQGFLLCDPQTAGGLFLSVDPAKRNELERAFENSSEPLHLIGEAVAGDPGTIEVV